MYRISPLSIRGVPGPLTLTRSGRPAWGDGRETGVPVSCSFTFARNPPMRQGGSFRGKDRAPFGSARQALGG
ncbi:hypothetical protein GCM10010431_10790 [Streptomyces kunmingensis]